VITAEQIRALADQCGETPVTVVLPCSPHVAERLLELESAGIAYGLLGPSDESELTPSEVTW
jgi:hypothetical protein